MTTIYTDGDSIWMSILFSRNTPATLNLSSNLAGMHKHNAKENSSDLCVFIVI